MEISYLDKLIRYDSHIYTFLERFYLDIFNDRPNITWLKDGVELNSFSEHEHVKFCNSKSKF